MTRVKICGITNLQDAVHAVEAGADLLGFNFYPPSPRSILLENCAPITRQIVQQFPQVTLVGVFVNLHAERVLDIMNSCRLHLAQLHGDEPADMLASFDGRAFKALRGVSDAPEVYQSYALHRQYRSPALLVDASVKGLYGGSGVTADWTAAALLAARCPVLLAGGLTPQNVAAAIQAVRPWGVDTASGVESAPGVKDLSKMREFIRSVRQTETEANHQDHPLEK